METILLSDFLNIVPDHARIGIVLKYYEYGNEYNKTLYSGYKKGILKYLTRETLAASDYKVNYCYVGSWDNKYGLIINVKYFDGDKNEKK